MPTIETKPKTQRGNQPALKKTYPLYLANEAVELNADLEVTNKYTGEVVARVAKADAGTVTKAIERAHESFDELRRRPAFARKAVLAHVVDRLKERRDELAHALCIEAGKPVKDSRGEVARSIDTFTIAMEESVRMYGEVQPLEISERAAGYHGYWKRVPIGPCSFITPWNFPINLVAHKVAPALAVGCPFVLKPASATPIGALMLGEILAETDLPKGAFSILPCSSKDAAPLVEDDRVKLLSFTGSHGVGWNLKARAGKKRVLLELGGNAATIVDESADIDLAAERITHGAFYQSGQSCISVQRIIVHEKIYEEFKSKLVARTKKLTSGDPLDEETFIGPIISEDDAKRIESWVDDAVRQGAKLLCGGTRSGSMYEATLLESPPHDARVSCEEVFGPVVSLYKVSDFDEAIRMVNDSDYGLQAGVFTNNLDHAFRAWNEIECGGVVINDSSSMRVDSMPYGGVKDSGNGREGIRFSMEEMTEIRLMVMRETT